MRDGADVELGPAARASTIARRAPAAAVSVRPTGERARDPARQRDAVPEEREADAGRQQREVGDEGQRVLEPGMDGCREAGCPGRPGGATPALRPRRTGGTTLPGDTCRACRTALAGGTCRTARTFRTGRPCGTRLTGGTAFTGSEVGWLIAAGLGLLLLGAAALRFDSSSTR